MALRSRRAVNRQMIVIIAGRSFVNYRSEPLLVWQGRGREAEQLEFCRGAESPQNSHARTPGQTQ